MKVNLLLWSLLALVVSAEKNAHSEPMTLLFSG